ncbi:protein IQ-DOMAIN 14-like [Telopea speciosissima]|uniref:protein IQ-DOMAIN 14-like n=1 Tax=Telopea speciosissima TaxID=54955 RepID=UPI001CC5DF8A|nr:protein IQ-DOMAIN 14-like [Telopea speciosissima]
MGKKPGWFSAIKRVFVSNSKEKLDDIGSEKLKSGKEKKKKWGLGILRHNGGDNSNSFIPGLHREPSSIEKILQDAERELQILPKKYSEMSSEQPPRPVAQPAAHPMSFDQRQRTPPDLMPSGSGVVSRHQKEAIGHNSIIITSPKNHQTSAIKIQAAFRGYMARRSFRALKGLVRLQGVMRGQSIKRQTMNALKQMQLLVRVQSQIQSRRIQMLDNKVDKELETSSLAKWTTTLPSTRDQEEWDDSQLTKEEEESRLQKKVEAVMKRERALAYAYSNQLWKATPKSAKAALVEIRSGGVPWWWNWVERELPGYPSEIHSATMHSNRADQINHQLTPPRPFPDPNLRRPPSSNNSKQPERLAGFDNHLETLLTPRSSKSVFTTTNTNTNNAPLLLSNNRATTPVMKHVKPRKIGGGGVASELSLGDVPLRDDASLTSCPPFSVPNYMVPTVSAKAKVRMANNNFKEREMMVGSSHDRKRRLSFPLTQSIGSLRWNKVFSSKDSSSQRLLEKNNTLQSIDYLSMDSTTSLPVGIAGRKPFKRFV